MFTEESVRTNPGAMEKTIEQQILLRTGGRIRMVRVALELDRVTVEGRVQTYYVKQLAIQALLEAIDAERMVPVVNIEVV